MTDLQYCDANQTSTTIKSDKSIKTVSLCECSGNESASYIHENKIPSFNKPFKSPIKLYWMNIHMPMADYSLMKRLTVMSVQ